MQTQNTMKPRMDANRHELNPVPISVHSCSLVVPNSSMCGVANTEYKKPRMDTNRHELILKEEVFQIVGAALDVLNGLGHGLLEKPYENALAVELGLRKIPFEQQRLFDVVYKNVKVGLYVPDLIAFNQVVIETKTIERITNIDRGQVINYLKITGLPVGVILNFKHPKLEWERIVL